MTKWLCTTLYKRMLGLTPFSQPDTSGQLHLVEAFHWSLFACYHSMVTAAVSGVPYPAGAEDTITAICNVYPKIISNCSNYPCHLILWHLEHLDWLLGVCATFGRGGHWKNSLGLLDDGSFQKMRVWSEVNRLVDRVLLVLVSCNSAHIRNNIRWRTGLTADPPLPALRAYIRDRRPPFEGLGASLL